MTKKLRSNDESIAAEASTFDGRTRDIVAVIRQFHGAVYRYAYRLSGSPDDAEDLTQQTFMVAAEKLYQVRDPAKTGSWLFSVLRSCFLKSRRKPTPICAASIELNVDEIPEQEDDGDAIDKEQLQEAINELPDDFKFVVLMFYFEDLSYQEIAERLEIKIGTVMSRLSRAKGRLRGKLLAKERDAVRKTVAPTREGQDGTPLVDWSGPTRVPR